MCSTKEVGYQRATDAIASFIGLDEHTGFDTLVLASYQDSSTTTTATETFLPSSDCTAAVTITCSNEIVTEFVTASSTLAVKSDFSSSHSTVPQCNAITVTTSTATVTIPAEPATEVIIISSIATTPTELASVYVDIVTEIVTTMTILTVEGEESSPAVPVSGSRHRSSAASDGLVPAPSSMTSTPSMQGIPDDNTKPCAVPYTPEERPTSTSRGTTFKPPSTITRATASPEGVIETAGTARAGHLSTPSTSNARSLPAAVGRPLDKNPLGTSESVGSVSTTTSGISLPSSPMRTTTTTNAIWPIHSPCGHRAPSPEQSLVQTETAEARPVRALPWLPMTFRTSTRAPLE
ncbi:hypothetical protein PFICI_00408 [Pestalotiopsis fici W106-1]|uniref:Uncharacterized protein n=1 Tax=Pestalotiopsis fici (strain W106-1 / CGMCC3.15140) TaxID=1229662 RepID=W3XKQ4_PESFW|nr:uncharacterized protein PFICI_00408 [Pestalotiopsis fici W106-1]ETS86580.1 hypothetical protein PFICI_00408 [Pestalotiopsis fici W106-1]